MIFQSIMMTDTIGKAVEFLQAHPLKYSENARFLYGSPDSIKNLVAKYKLPVSPSETPLMVVVDKKGIIRGYFDIQNLKDIRRMQIALSMIPKKRDDPEKRMPKQK
jgi:hypothetical protein